MAASALSVLSPAPSADLVSFVSRHNRLPCLGDARAPWHYCGWLLAYVIHESCPAVADRWGYHLRTLEAGRLLDEPIPQIAFGSPDKRVAFDATITPLSDDEIDALCERLNGDTDKP